MFRIMEELLTTLVEKDEEKVKREGQTKPRATFETRGFKVGVVNRRGLF